jgi:hypothetical protein
MAAICKARLDGARARLDAAMANSTGENEEQE